MNAPAPHAEFQDILPNVGDAVLIQDAIWTLDNDGLLQGFAFSEDRKSLTPTGQLDMTKALLEHLTVTETEPIHFILIASWQSSWVYPNVKTKNRDF